MYDLKIKLSISTKRLEHNALKDNTRYADYVKQAIIEEFPEAKVRITLADTVKDSRVWLTLVDDNSDECEIKDIEDDMKITVRRIANQAYNKKLY